MSASSENEIDELARSEIARVLGSIKTPRKSQASRENINRINESKKLHGVSEETKARLKEAQQKRREREKQARIEAGKVIAEPKEKKPVGRPRKPQTESPSEPVIEGKRGRGRPKKADAS